MKTPKYPADHLPQDPEGDKLSSAEITDDITRDAIRKSNSPVPEPSEPISALDRPLPGLDAPLPKLDTPIPALDTPIPVLDTPTSVLDKSIPELDNPEPPFDEPFDGPANQSSDAPEDQKKLDFTERLEAFQNRSTQTDKHQTKPKDPNKADHASDAGKTASTQLVSMNMPIPKAEKQKVKKNALKRALLVVLLVFLLSGLGIGGFYMVALKDIPRWDLATLDNMKVPSCVYDKDGNEMGRLSSTENQWPFKYEDLPHLLVQTLLAVENKDVSTLAAQLAKKTLTLSKASSVGFVYSIQENVLIAQIEREYSPEEITAAYFTQLFFGHGAFGVRSASQVYFGKEPADLTIPEIALLCGLPQAPGKDDPYIDSARAKERRTDILGIMRDNNLITKEDYEKFQNEPFTFLENLKNGTASINSGQGSKTNYPYYFDYVVNSLLSNDTYNLIDNQDQNQERNQERNQEMANLIYNGGLHIYTTLDPKIQQAAQDVMKDPKNYPETAEAKRSVQGAVVVLDNATGNVVAMVGGRETPETQQFGFNRAIGKRQLGTAALPLIAYAPAIEKGGFFAGTVLDDAPVTYDGWSPKNLKNRNSGLITMREALMNSVNIYTVKLYIEANPDYCWNFARINLGLELKGNESSQLTNALGSFRATPMETARAYAAFSNQGTLNEPRCITRITDSADTVLLEPEASPSKAMKESTAYVLSDLMRSAVTDGTGKGAAFDNWYICGKTGTADLDPVQNSSGTGYQDAWFAGYSPIYTASVWLGYDLTDGEHYLSTEYGTSKPADIWKQIMQKAHEGIPVQSSKDRPADVIDIEFDAMSGLLPGPLTPAALVKKDIGTKDSVPTLVSDVWIELNVDRDRPAYLANPGDPFVAKRFLKLDRAFWAEKELPYKPPTEFAVVEEPVEPIPTPSYNQPSYNSSRRQIIFTGSSSGPQVDTSKYVAVVTIQGANNRSEVLDNIQLTSSNSLTVSLSNALSRGSYTITICYKEIGSSRRGSERTYSLTVSY